MLINISEINISVKYALGCTEESRFMTSTDIAAEDCYFVERTEDDVTGSDLIDQSAERGV